MSNWRDVQAIQAVQKALGEALVQKDLDRAVSLMTADVALLGQKGPAVVGHKAARKMYANLFEKFNITVSRADSTVETVGDAAVVIGSQTTTLIPVGGGRANSVAGRVIAVYRREGRSWQLARAMSVFTGIASSDRIPAHKYRSELLGRERAEPGRIIRPALPRKS